MSFASISGYTPVSIETMMDSVMTNINTQFGTTYTTETFIGTNFYKYFYALIQRLQENEVKTSEIFLKLQDYFRVTNERISRPAATNPGLIEALNNAGYVASIKKPIDADAGKVYVAVDVTGSEPTYTTMKLAINTIIKNSTAAGTVSQGTESSTIVLSNGQAFDFKFKKPNRISVLLKLTVTTSVNNHLVIGDPDDTKNKLLTNILSRYSLGKNFEPDTYFSISDAPWAASVKLEYSLDAGTTWLSTVYSAAYDDLFTILLANITLVEL